MDKTNYILPAEWYTQSAIMLTWPHADTDWQPYLDDITLTYIELARAITKQERLVIAAQQPDEVKQLLANALPARLLKRISFSQCPIDDTWARDHGPLTLLPLTPRYFNMKEGGAHAITLKFEFNGWGDKYPHHNDNNIALQLFADGHLTHELEAHTDFVLEGGSIESDGRGTIFTTSMCQLKRNQPLTLQQIEEELKRRLRAQRIVFLHHGQLEGDDTDGHIDTIVRLAPRNTIVYTACDNPTDPHYEEFQALEQQIADLRDATGKPYKLLRLPLPDAIYETDGQRLPATYANFLVINKAVIMPTYNQPAKDETAAEVLAKAFPNREIVRIDARTIIRQHGSIHCLTMQFPQGTAK